MPRLWVPILTQLSCAVARPCSFTPGPLPAPHGEPAPGCSVLTAEQLDFFDRCGYLVLQQIIPKAEADRFVAETIIPGLRSRGVDPDDPSNWHTGEKWHIILPGCCRGHKNVANHNRCGAMVSSVVPDASQQYKPLYESEQLLGVLDDLHGTDDANELPGGGGDGVDGRSQATGEQTRRWEWLRPGLGNTHVRYPLPVRQRYAYPAQAAARLWNPPSLGWHIDGAHFQGHRVGSRQQSMIVLPVFGDVEPGGGATAIVAGSHKVRRRVTSQAPPPFTTLMRTTTSTTTTSSNSRSDKPPLRRWALPMRAKLETVL